MNAACVSDLFPSPLLVLPVSPALPSLEVLQARLDRVWNKLGEWKEPSGGNPGYGE